MRLLVVEDNVELAGLLAKGLHQAGYAADVFGTAIDAKAALMTTIYAAVILDLGLPKMSGLTVLKQLRARGEAQRAVPVLVTTAMDSVHDRVEGLDAGADDYLVKPFALDELHARVRALIRRRNAASSNILHHGNLTFDLSSRQASAFGQQLELSVREAGILEVLLLRAGRAVTKEQLLEKIYAWDSDISLNAIEVYVHRLRKKLEPAGLQVRTFRGLGYCIDKARPVETA